jgi:hypothetical protein
MQINRRYNPDRHGTWCWYCHAGLTAETATKDHIVPVSKGGTNHWYNLAWSCRQCNSKKRDLSLEEFRPIFEQMTGKSEFAFETSDLIRRHFTDAPPNNYEHRLLVPLGHIMRVPMKQK